MTYILPWLITPMGIYTIVMALFAGYGMWVLEDPILGSDPLPRKK